MRFAPAATGEKLVDQTTMLDPDSFGTPAQPLDLGWASLAEDAVLSYLRAVGDELPLYSRTGLAPPLFGVALALGRILQRRSLPPGAIHSLQEFDTLRPIPIGSSLRTFACLERQRERAGLRFLTFGVNMDTREGDSALAVKTTLLIPGENSSHDPAQPAGSESAGGRTPNNSGNNEMIAVGRTISQQQLADYAAVSGDDNPLHLDAEFAAGTQFGGIIAHGMLTLAFVSEMLTASLGEAWLTGGSMRARFKGAAYLGDWVKAWGRAAKSDGNSRSFNIGLFSGHTGGDLITGTATVKTNQ